jgi:long-chain acyl-CoA synthetase
MSTDKPWLQSYPAGTPETVDLDEYASVAAVLDAACERYRARPAFSNMGRTLTYADVDRLSSQFASYLLNVLKLKKGDRVAIMLPNVLQYPVALFGVLRAGLTVVNTNPMYTARELKHQLADAGASVLVVLDNFAHTAAEILRETPVRQVVTTGLGDLLGFPKSAVVNFVARHVKKLVPDYRIDGAVRFNDALAQGSARPAPRVDIGHDDIAFLQYTGGTTGVAKGAMLTQRAAVAEVLSLQAWYGTQLRPGLEVYVIALPIYHVAALAVGCLMGWAIGARMVLVANPRDLPALVRDFARERPTVFGGVTTLYDALLRTPGIEAVDFSRLRVSMEGGAAMHRSTAQRWQALTGCTLLESYGLSETCGAITGNPPGGDNPPGSIGQPLPGAEVRICDDDGRDRAPGEAGELCFRAPHVALGYWQRPEETRAAFFDGGWFRTGDIGRMDERGYLYVLDRKKDMILVSGFNVYPNEIEDVVGSHPGVLESAAVGVPDERSGEAIKLVVVARDPGLTEEALRAHCRSQLTGYKQPRYIEFRDALPKTNVGKILRRELRDSAPRSPA